MRLASLQSGDQPGSMETWSWCCNPESHILKSGTHTRCLHCSLKAEFLFLQETSVFALQTVNWLDEAYLCYTDFPGGSDGKASIYNAGDPGSIPGSERSPGEGNGNPLQYSCLENSMDRGAEQVTSMGSQRVGYNCVTNFHFLSSSG